MICEHILLAYPIKWSNNSISNDSILQKSKLNGLKYCYVSDNSIKFQYFVYTELNDQTILFQTIQFSMSFVCT